MWVTGSSRLRMQFPSLNIFCVHSKVSDKNFKFTSMKESSRECGASLRQSVCRFCLNTVSSQMISYGDKMQYLVVICHSAHLPSIFQDFLL